MIYSVDKLEEKVASIVRSVLGAPTVTETLLSVLRTEAQRLQSGAVDRLKALQKEETDVSRKLENALDAVLEGMNSPALKKRIAELESQQKAVRSQIAALRKQVEAASLPDSRIRELLVLCQQQENIDALLSIVTRVEITNEHIIVWTILDPDPETVPDYDTPGIPLGVTITDGTASGLPSVFVTSQLLRLVVAR